MWQDKVNGLFELLGAPFICLSIIKLYKDKQVHGINWLHACFFMVWGYWNLYYYPAINQWYSFIGGITVVLANTFWFIQLIYYSKKNGR